MIRKIFGLTPEVLNISVLKATAGQLAEAERIVSTVAYKNSKPALIRDINADSFVKWANEDGGGNIFKKTFFRKDYKLTDKGKKWIGDWLYKEYDLDETATLQDIISAGISKIKNSVK